MWMRVKSVTLKVVLIGALCVIGVLSFGLLRAQPGDEQDPPSVGDLVALLSSEDGAVRAEATKALGEMGPDAADAVDPLLDVLDDEDPYVRWYAVNALWEIGVATENVLTGLQERFSDECIAIRVHALNAQSSLAGKLRAEQAEK